MKLFWKVNDWPLFMKFSNFLNFHPAWFSPLGLEFGFLRIGNYLLNWSCLYPRNQSALILFLPLSSLIFAGFSLLLCNLIITTTPYTDKMPISDFFSNSHLLLYIANLLLVYSLKYYLCGHIYQTYVLSFNFSLTAHSTFWFQNGFRSGMPNSTWPKTNLCTSSQASSFSYYVPYLI